MKRPFACVGLGALAAMAAAAAYSGAALYIAAVCLTASAVLFALRIFLKKESFFAAAVIMVSAAAGACAFFGAQTFSMDSIAERYGGERVTFSGVIIDEPYTNGRTTFFTVKTDEINGEPEKVRISVASDTVPGGGAYDLIEGTAVLSAVSPDGTGLGAQTRLNARRVFLEAYIGAASKTRYTVSRNESPPPWKKISDMRAAIARAFRGALSQPEAALCTAMVTGDKSGLPDSVNRRFGTLGVAHMIVVSGLHLSIAAALFGAVFRRLFRSRYICCAAELAGVFAFAALTAFGWSACRALVMISVMILSRLANAKADALNSLGIAALVLLCTNPFAAGDIGLLWSFCCTFSMIVLADPICRALGRLFPGKDAEKRLLPELFSAAAAAFVGSMPFAVLVTKTISVYTVVVNVLTVPVTGIVILCGGVGAILSVCGLSALSALPLVIAGAAAKYLLFITELFYSLPGASIPLESGAFAVWLAASAAGAALIWLISERKDVLLPAAALCAASFLLILSAQVLAGAQRVTLTLADVGSGITAVLRFGESSAVLAAYGEPYQYTAVKEAVGSAGEPSVIVDIPPKGVRYDYTRKLMHDFSPELAVVRDDKVRLRSCAWYEYSGGQTAAAGETYTLELPQGDTAELWSSDALSCCFLTLRGHTVLICCGEGELPERYSASEIAVVCSGEQLPQLSAQTQVIVSDFDYGYTDERIINATNGEGRLDLTFSGSGVRIKQAYTGGVVRYADSDGG